MRDTVKTSSCVNKKKTVIHIQYLIQHYIVRWEITGNYAETCLMRYPSLVFIQIHRGQGLIIGTLTHEESCTGTVTRKNAPALLDRCTYRYTLP